MMSEYKIFRGSVNGEQKYCRILIRRKRESIENAIQYFQEAVQEIDEIISEYEEGDQKELRFEQACFVTALDALHAQSK